MAQSVGCRYSAHRRLLAPSFPVRNAGKLSNGNNKRMKDEHIMNETKKFFHLFQIKNLHCYAFTLNIRAYSLHLHSWLYIMNRNYVNVTWLSVLNSSYSLLSHLQFQEVLVIVTSHVFTSHKSSSVMSLHRFGGWVGRWEETVHQHREELMHNYYSFPSWCLSFIVFKFITGEKAGDKLKTLFIKLKVKPCCFHFSMY